MKILIAGYLYSLSTMFGISRDDLHQKAVFLNSEKLSNTAGIIQELSVDAWLLCYGLFYSLYFIYKKINVTT